MVKAENAADTESIFHDPFRKPELTKLSVGSKTIDQSNKPTWRPQLIMTLRAGKNSMANIDGQIISLGDSIDGYKLIEVSERAVVFVNQGEVTRVTLDEE